MSNADDRKVSLRPVTEADTDFLLKVYESGREHELSLVQWMPEQREQFVRHQYAAQILHYQTQFPDAVHSVIEYDGVPAGRIYVQRSADQIQILDLAILSDHRGKGISTPVIRGLQDEAADGKKPLRIHVDTSGPFIDIFRKFGFADGGGDEVSRLMEWKSPY